MSFMAKSRRMLVVLVLAASPLAAQPPDLETLGRIREEGLKRSQVMEIARQLTDGFGPRLTGSPGLERAGEWARDQMTGWGLTRARLEPFEFGQGWTWSRSVVTEVSPVVLPLAAVPKAWTIGTSGPVRGEIVQATLDDDEALERWRGKLAGKIVLLDDGSEDAPRRGGPERQEFERWDDARLAELVAADLDEPRGERWRQGARKRLAFARQQAEFFAAEGVLATIELSSREFGILRVGGDTMRRDPSYPRGVPGLVLAAEPYRRLLRRLEEDERIELEVDVATQFLDGQTVAYNTLAEIPGGDKRNELVIAGAHLDSWHAGTGATDNAAGSAVVLEAVRILQAIGAKPRRTIRVALWAGEEQGLLGSRAYVEQHVADRPEPTDPAELELPRAYRKETWPIRRLAEHGRISAYFNLDNGGGRIRGIYAQENLPVGPIFQSWLAPLADLGATTVTQRATGSTDHVAFDRVGVPGFQFIQDPLDYFARTHHSHLDTYERLQREDLVQASIVMASFLWQAAQRDNLLPRKPFPVEPVKETSTAGAD